jgi:hypothetical protein
MSRADSADDLDRLLECKAGLAQRAAAAPVVKRLEELRAWQAERLARTYADLRRDPLAADAVSFFLSDLYGPQDLTRRDEDVARAWRLLKRALPPRMLAALALAMELEVLSAQLDLDMARQLAPGPLTGQAYAEAYRAVGRPEARRRQIGLIVEIGTALVRAVHSPLVRLGLRAAHAPAHLAGFGVLQDFLERGFAAFEKLPHPAELLTTIERREMRLMQILLEGGTIAAQEPAPSASRSA